MKRETGYYWVNHCDEWTAGFYDNDNDSWALVGSDVTVKDGNMKEVDESKIVKLKQDEWIDVNTSLPKINEACLVKLVTDNKKRRSQLNLPPLWALGMPTDFPDEIIIFGNLSPFDGKWEVAYFKINPDFQKVTHWKSCNPKRVKLIKEYIDKFEKDNEKL